MWDNVFWRRRDVKTDNPASPPPISSHDRLCETSHPSCQHRATANVTCHQFNAHPHIWKVKSKASIFYPTSRVKISRMWAMSNCADHQLDFFSHHVILMWCHRHLQLSISGLYAQKYRKWRKIAYSRYSEWSLHILPCLAAGLCNAALVTEWKQRLISIEDWHIDKT